MKINRIFAAAVLVTLLLISCKNDADSKEDATSITTEKVNSLEKKEPVKRTKPLTIDQQKAANSLQLKLMKTNDVEMFTRALVTAGMLQEVSNLEIEYTVLAANNDVFENLEPGQNVLTDPSRKSELIELLSNHIIKGTISSADLVQEIKKNSKYELTTIHDKTLIATMKDEVIIISNADASKTVSLGKTDINGTNGVLHVVDGLFK